jgi:hypothetical protein
MQNSYVRAARGGCRIADAKCISGCAGRQARVLRDENCSDATGEGGLRLPRGPSPGVAVELGVSPCAGLGEALGAAESTKPCVSGGGALLREEEHGGAGMGRLGLLAWPDVLWRRMM